MQLISVKEKRLLKSFWFLHLSCVGSVFLYYLLMTSALGTYYLLGFWNTLSVSSSGYVVFMYAFSVAVFYTGAIFLPRICWRIVIAFSSEFVPAPHFYPLSSTVFLVLGFGAISRGHAKVSLLCVAASWIACYDVRYLWVVERKLLKAQGQNRLREACLFLSRLGWAPSSEYYQLDKPVSINGVLGLNLQDATVYLKRSWIPSFLFVILMRNSPIRLYMNRILARKFGSSFSTDGEKCSQFPNERKEIHSCLMIVVDSIGMPPTTGVHRVAHILIDGCQMDYVFAEDICEDRDREGLDEILQQVLTLAGSQRMYAFSPPPGYVQ